MTNVVYLSAFNYKVNAEVAVTRNSLEHRLTVLDTGAGPNLIRADLLPHHVLSDLIAKNEIVNLASASNHRLDTLGITTSTVKVSNQITRSAFVAVDQLRADVILGGMYRVL